MVARDAGGFEQKIRWHASTARMTRQVGPEGRGISSDRCEKERAYLRIAGNSAPPTGASTGRVEGMHLANYVHC